MTKKQENIWYGVDREKDTDAKWLYRKKRYAKDVAEWFAPPLKVKKYKLIEIK